MLKRILQLTVFLSLIAALAAAVIILDREGHFNINDIDITIQSGQESVYQSNRIKKLQAEIGDLKGTSLLRLNSGEIVERLTSSGWINKVSILRRWPNQLHVVVIPHNIPALFLSSDDKLKPILENGEFLDEIAFAEAPDVVILRGDNFARDMELRLKALSMLQDIPAAGRLSKQLISEIFYDRKMGFLLSLIPGIQVRFGETSFAAKALHVSQVLAYLGDQNLEGRVIDARFSKKVLVKPRKQPLTSN